MPRDVVLPYGSGTIQITSVNTNGLHLGPYFPTRREETKVEQVGVARRGSNADVVGDVIVSEREAETVSVRRDTES